MPPIQYLTTLDLPFILHTDASDTYVGAILEQAKRPVAFFSRKLSATKCNYSVSDCELLAIILACQQWYCYLHGALSMVVYTDHQPLVHLFTQPSLNPRQTRWLERLAEFQLDIQYVQGPANVVADCLLCPAAIEGLHVVEDTTLRAVLPEWLSAVALHLDLDSFILSGVATLRASKLGQTLGCPQCSMLHLCGGLFVTQKHIDHTCIHCSAVFA